MRNVVDLYEPEHLPTPTTEPEARVQFFIDLCRERERQDRLHAPVRETKPHLNRWDRFAYYLKFITEEVGEVADATEKAERAALPYDSIRKELVEVAALCLRMIEDEGL